MKTRELLQFPRRMIDTEFGSDKYCILNLNIYVHCRMAVINQLSYCLNHEYFKFELFLTRDVFF